VVVLDVLRHGPPEMPLADRNQAVQAFVLQKEAKHAHCLQSVMKLAVKQVFVIAILELQVRKGLSS
jgi:hypothetical protein